MRLELIVSVDIIAKKHDGGRGQAFVTFDEQAAATAAMRALHGEMFYSKELVCPSSSFVHAQADSL